VLAQTSAQYLCGTSHPSQGGGQLGRLLPVWGHSRLHHGRTCRMQATTEEVEQPCH
jgi:hypothetical protein